MYYKKEEVTNVDPHNFFNTPAAFGMRVRHLLADIEAQLEESLAASGCNVMATTTGIVLLLYGEESLSIADIAKRLRYSHQLATKRVRIIEGSGFAASKDDPDDGRRRIVSLTREGKREARKLVDYLGDLEKAFRSVFDDIGTDALDVVIAADEALLGRSLAARMFSPRKIRRRA